MNHKRFIVWIACCLFLSASFSEAAVPGKRKATGEKENLFPVKGFSINNPNESEMDAFCRFIDEELAPLGVNLLLLRINYQFQFQSVDIMGSKQGMSPASARRLESVCEKNHIQLVPHMELFGHQSGTAPVFNSSALLKSYPQFDEAAGKADSVNYGYRSYCPLHPGLHPVLYKMIDEMASTFKTNNFHVGCDEVMTLGICDRCKTFLNNGGTNADLFADEINRLSGFLTSKGYRTWIWGDRLINTADAPMYGVETLSEWEASKNNTYPAIDKISKNILICDWHYKVAPTTHQYFAEKGFDVIPCFYNVEKAAMDMLANVVETRTKETDPNIRNHCLGIMGTNWGSSVTAFMEEYMKVKNGTNSSKATGAYVFYTVFNEIKRIESDFKNQKE